MEPYWKDVAGALVDVAQDTRGQDANAFGLHFVRSNQRFDTVTVSKCIYLLRVKPICHPFRVRLLLSARSRAQVHTVSEQGLHISFVGDAQYRPCYHRSQCSRKPSGADFRRAVQYSRSRDRRKPIRQSQAAVYHSADNRGLPYVLFSNRIVCYSC